MTLEWQLRNVQANTIDGVKKRKFGIQYHDLERDRVEQQELFYGLVVFTWETSKILSISDAELCTKQIISVVKEKRLPFILCLKHVNVNTMKNSMVILNETVKMLRVDIDTTHLIIKTETPLGEFVLFCFPDNDCIDLQARIMYITTHLLHTRHCSKTIQTVMYLAR